MSVSFRVEGHIHPGYCDIAKFRRLFQNLLTRPDPGYPGDWTKLAQMRAGEESLVTEEPAPLTFANGNAMRLLRRLGMEEAHQGEASGQEILYKIASRRSFSLDQLQATDPKTGAPFGELLEGIEERVEKLRLLAIEAERVGGYIRWL